MDRKLVLEQLAELPEAAQQQVLDYIAFLYMRYSSKQSEPLLPENDLYSELFVGMWSDRRDMQDSTNWVRETRQNDW